MAQKNGVLDLTVLYDLDSTHFHIFFIPIIGQEKKSVENRRVTQRFFEIIEEELAQIYTFYEKFRSKSELRAVNIAKISESEMNILKNIPGETAIEKLETIGRTIFQSLFPIQIRNYLKEYSISTVLINSEKFLIPFELMHDGHSFLSTKIEFYRNPIFKAGEKETPSISTKAKKLPGTVVFFTNPTSDLDEAENEVTKIIDFFKSKEKLNLDIKEYSQEGASYNALANIFPKYRLDIFHYSGHSKITENDIQFHLKDYPFSINDVSLHYPALFFLNMCEADITVQHKIVFKGYESLNFPMALMKQGAKACIATFWPIVDKSAAEFATIFYQQAIKGYTFGRSLCSTKAQLSKISDPNDITWMSFLLYGDPSKALLNGIIEITDVEIFEEILNVMEVIIMHHDGRTIESFDFNKLEENHEKPDPGLVGGMFSAIISFADETFKFKDGLSEMGYGDNTLLIDRGEFIRVVLVLRKKASIFLKNKLDDFIELYERVYHDILVNWNGSMQPFNNTGKLLDDIMNIGMIAPHEFATGNVMLDDLEKSISKDLFRILERNIAGSEENVIYIPSFIEKALFELKTNLTELYNGIEELKDKKTLIPAIERSRFAF